MSNSQLIYEKFLFDFDANSDIRPHLALLNNYADGCSTIVELGFRGGVSTSALMAGNPEKLTIIDWDKPPFEIDRERLESIKADGESQGTVVEFESRDSLEKKIPECELLFLDTFHTYEHLFLELILHSDSVTKFLAIHDTHEPACPGMMCAVEDFLLDNPHWEINIGSNRRPGMVVLCRKWTTRKIEHSEEYHEFVLDYSKDKVFRYSKAFVATLQAEVRAQKEMYYKEICSGGSCNQEWRDYTRAMQHRFSDAERWPLSNKKLSVMDVMASRKETTSPQTNS